MSSYNNRATSATILEFYILKDVAGKSSEVKECHSSPYFSLILPNGTAFWWSESNIMLDVRSLRKPSITMQNLVNSAHSALCGYVFALNCENGKCNQENKTRISAQSLSWLFDKLHQTKTYFGRPLDRNRLHSQNIISLQGGSCQTARDLSVPKERMPRNKSDKM
jgi:hypothetical protein